MIGATPVRPESLPLATAMSHRPSFYDSDEWAEWSDRIAVLAERYDVDITDLDKVHADGLWMGESEPSGAYEVTGTRENINAWAAHVAGHYEQDAVMVLRPGGPDTLYTFEGVQADTQGVLDRMGEAGIPGGRLIGDRLEIVSSHEEPITPAALDLIQHRLGVTPTAAPVTVDFIEKDPDRVAHRPIKEIQWMRQAHAEKHGLPVRGAMPHLTDADDMAAADAYEAAVHDPADPRVARSYRALRRHIVEQHDALTAAGYIFEPWEDTGREQPYADSAEMMADLRENKHLYYFRTEVSQDSDGALPPDHPMGATVTVSDGAGGTRQVVLNDAFRAVHDAIAHSEGHKFGPMGERAAWWAHRSSLPREAHGALFAETRGQNVVTNAGVHARTQDGSRLLTKGEPGWLPLSQRPYAAQKACWVDPSLT